MIPKLALAEQKYRRSEKSGSGRNCALHFLRFMFISQSSTALPEAKTDSLFDQLNQLTICRRTHATLHKISPLTRRTKKPTTATNHYGTLQLKQKPPASQSALLLFDHAFQGDFPRPAMRWRSVPCGSPCHLISFHLHFNVN